ncbi:MAG: phosphatidylserine decarboxylase [Alphaproteobacteria bacterium]|nr:phosphatidylserine decarboxylase [Alphaproteobacteria bacterium]
MFRSVAFRLHPEGAIFVAGGALITLILGWVWAPLGALGLVLTGWMAYFFRDPDRVVPIRPGLILSPADGEVSLIVDAPPPADLGMGSTPVPRVSIFLNIFDVHVQRVPAEGSVTAVAYRPGAFINAALDKASEDNERMSVRMTLAVDGRDIAFVQIAGLIARRIKCTLKQGQSVRAGERYGLIRFGSRVDVYLPAGAVPLVCVGQRAIGGETVIADLASGEGARQGEVR